MSKLRKIRLAIKSRPTIEGAGVHLKRSFGFSHAGLFDPFLLLDDFRSTDPEFYLRGFPWHPHRGIETITYMLQGTVEHGDSLGNSGIIYPGAVQWMTAGSGIIHQEMPKGDSRGLMGGFQLWANLPRTQKMTEPKYRGIEAEQIPEIVTDAGVKIKVISGQLGEIQGPVQGIAIDPVYMDIGMPPHAKFRQEISLEHTAVAYVISGGGYFCDMSNPYTYPAEGINYFDFPQDSMLDNETLVLFADGDEIKVVTETEPCRFLLFSGKPLREPIAWYGPIVMNTMEELRLAFDEYSKGIFIKIGQEQT
jgi:quercetin 2,3-dioxygenase